MQRRREGLGMRLEAHVVAGKVDGRGAELGRQRRSHRMDRLPHGLLPKADHDPRRRVAEFRDSEGNRMVISSRP